MFKFIKEGKDISGSHCPFDPFKYFFDQFVENDFPYHSQNKVQIFTFQNLRFTEIELITLNLCFLSIHPIYSKDLIIHLNDRKFKYYNLERK